MEKDFIGFSRGQVDNKLTSRLERFFIYKGPEILSFHVGIWFFWGRRPQKTSQRRIFQSDQPGTIFQADLARKP